MTSQKKNGMESKFISGNFLLNPETEYRSDTNSGVVIHNPSPYANWGIKSRKYYRVFLLKKRTSFNISRYL